MNGCRNKERGFKMAICILCDKGLSRAERNNPNPLEVKGQVCDSCNITYIVKARESRLGDVTITPNGNRIVRIVNDYILIDGFKGKHSK